MSRHLSALPAVRARFPWPTKRPDVPPVPWNMDYGGRRLISRAISRRGMRVVLEIGSWLGGSARQWLASSPDVVVVCVDAWPTLDAPSRHMTRHELWPRFGAQLGAVDGLYNSFLAWMWDFRERVIPVRGRSCEMLPLLHSLGLQPELVFLDAGKQGEEIAVCDDLFPAALIGGDDWYFTDGTGFPLRTPTRASAARRGRVLKVFSNTWLIDDRPWTLDERLWRICEAPTDLLMAARAARQRWRGMTSAGGTVAGSL